ncbi:MAG TPA: DinB family protein [Mycobacteriales bacterium]|nr:DinB family protein [Mycobacteriales bacterium]
MTSFTKADDLQGATFDHVNLRGARLVASDLSGVIMRGVEVTGADIDAPWLGGTFLVNGVDVVPFVEAELNRRFPGRDQQRASDPNGLRSAWAALERAWAPALDRAAAMPAGTVDISVDGEWSFAQTLRHLVLATDTWLGKAVLQLDEPFHPLGIGGADTPATVPYAEVLEARAGRVRMVREFLAAVTPDELNTERRNPHAPEYPETTLSCLHTILEEEWAHHRYALRDLDAIEARAH